MREKEIFQQFEVPYTQLQRLGLDKETLSHLPKEVTDPLMNGSVTPVIQGRIEVNNGYRYQIPLKLQLTHDEEGKVVLMTYPLRKEIDNSLHLTRDELKRVADGEVLKRNVTDKDGVRRMKYIQLDPETRSMMMRDVASLQMVTRLKDMEKIKDIELGQNQKEAAQEGKPIELNVGDEKVTVGVDLREPQGFKVVNGDMDEWRRQQAIRYDETHPEVMGYVQTDKNHWEYEQLIIHQREQGLSQAELEKEQKKRTGLIR